MSDFNHFKESERLLVEAGDLQADYEDASVWPLLLRSHVHATLALTQAIRAGQPRSWVAHKPRSTN